MAKHPTSSRNLRAATPIAPDLAKATRLPPSRSDREVLEIIFRGRSDPAQVDAGLVSREELRSLEEAGFVEVIPISYAVREWGIEAWYVELTCTGLLRYPRE